MVCDQQLREKIDKEIMRLRLLSLSTLVSAGFYIWLQSFLDPNNMPSILAGCPPEVSQNWMVIAYAVKALIWTYVLIGAPFWIWVMAIMVPNKLKSAIKGHAKSKLEEVSVVGAGPFVPGSVFIGTPNGEYYMLWRELSVRNVVEALSINTRRSVNLIRDARSKKVLSVVDDEGLVGAVMFPMPSVYASTIKQMEKRG